MKYYSEILEKFFDSEDACADAEYQFKLREDEEKLREEEFKQKRAARETEIATARVAYLESRKHYNDLVNAYYSDYGMLWTLPSGETVYKNISDILFGKIL